MHKFYLKSGFSSSDINEALNGNTVAKEYKLDNGGIIVHVTVPVLTIMKL